MILTPETIRHYKQILSEPAKFGFSFPPLSQCFKESDAATPKHTLYKEYCDYIENNNVPKVIFYIIMDELYSTSIAKAPNGDLGYKLLMNKQ